MSSNLIARSNKQGHPATGGPFFLGPLRSKPPGTAWYGLLFAGRLDHCAGMGRATNSSGNDDPAWPVG